MVERRRYLWMLAIRNYEIAHRPGHEEKDLLVAAGISQSTLSKMVGMKMSIQTFL